MPDMNVDYESRRQHMVSTQIVNRGIRDVRLISAMSSIPRHLFVPADECDMAYSDGPLPIGKGQTISQPYIVALMTDLLSLTGTERVLEVGTGCGYQAAVLSKMAKEVHSVEIIPELARDAQETLTILGYSNVRVHLGDGSLGWDEFAPYNAILVAAAAPKVPYPILEQLADNGRLVIPVGGRGFQELEKWERKGSVFTNGKNIPVSFVPLRGQLGWK